MGRDNGWWCGNDALRQAEYQLEQGMSEEIVTIARYIHPLAAQAAFAHLQNEGIRASLTGDVISDIFPGNATLPQYQLQVVVSDQERAVALLAELENAELDPDWEEKVERGAGWLCSLCGSEVRQGMEVCPDCLTERGAVMAPSPLTTIPTPLLPPGVPEDALQKFQPAAPPPPGLSEPSEPDEEVQLPGEDDLRVDSALAHQALLCAIFGPLACGLLNVYSLYVIWKLANMPAMMTPRASRQVLLALGIDIVWIFFLAAFVLHFSR
jgi:hypothetical protein